MRMLSACFAGRAIYSLAFPLAVIPILSPLASARATAQAVQLSTMRQNVLFPSTTVGANSSSITVPLVVNADGIIISAISVGTSAGGKQEFTIQSIGCALNTALPKGTACNVEVTFSPGSAGNRSAPLQVATYAANFYFGMEGVGIGPQVALNPATINTAAGNGQQVLSGDGGPAISAGVPVPIGIALDSAGNLYITDVVDDAIRIVAANSGIITSVAGWAQATTVHKPMGVEVNAIPSSVAVDSAGNIYIADIANNVIREISAATGNISAVVYVNAARLNEPEGLAFDDSDNLYIADSGNNVVRKINAATKMITTVAGNQKPGYSGDGGAATGAELNGPTGIAVDGSGNLYIADHLNNVIRKVTASGIITTIAGNGTAGFSGDGGSATSAELHAPGAVSVDSAGDLYIVDTNNSRIREVSAKSGIITTLAGMGTAGFGGDGFGATAAELNYPNAIALDGTGNLYIADSLNNRIRKINVLDSNLYFATTPIGFSSLDSPQTATVANIGNAPLVFSVPSSGLNPSVSPNFGLSTSSTCPQLDISSSSASLAPGGFCSLLLSFTPIQTGPISGMAAIADNATSTPPFVQTVHLNATGLPASAGRPDFSLSATPSTQTILPNSPKPAPAVYTVTVTGIYGFSGNVALTATGLPSNATANFAPASVTVSGAKASAALTIAIPKTKAESMPVDNHFSGKGSALEYGLLLLGFPLLGLAGKRKQLRSASGKAFLILVVLATLGAAATSLSGCANIGLELQPQNYTITITGTSGNLQRSSTLALTVEQYRKIKYH